nr:MAG: L protein [Salarius guttatus piscichuvirus]
MFSKTFFRLAEASPELLVNNRKFDLALRDTDVKLLRENLSSDPPSLNTRILLLNTTPEELRAARVDCRLWPIILGDILTQSKLGESIQPFRLDSSNRLFQLVRENLEFQHGHLMSCLLTDSNEKLYEKYGEWDKHVSEVPILIRNLIYLENELGVIVEQAGALVHKLRSRQQRADIHPLKGTTTYTCKLLDLRVCWTKTVTYIVYKGEGWLMPANYLLLLHNKICDALSALMLIHSSEGVCYERKAFDISVDLLCEICTLAVCRDDYFEIAKALEGLIIAETLMTEEAWYNPTLRNSIAYELSKTGYQYEASNLQHILQEASTPLRHELAGFIKIPGHPIINVPGTAKKAEERALKASEVNYYAIQMTRNLALEQLVRNHIIRHGVWPPVTVSEEAPSALKEAHRLNKDPKSPVIRRRYGEVTTEMFVHVDLHQILEFDKLDHYSQYLKDKAVTMLRQDATAYYITHELEKVDWKEGRLLLVHLLHHEDELDLPGYLRSYCQSSESMEDILNYLVIKLVPKEKELKIEARPFGCKTYQDRYRSCVQEENVKHMLDLYFEDQAMTLDNLSLVKRLYTFRNLATLYKGWRVLYINFDVSGWCGNFRHETVEPIAADVLDAAFGTDRFFSKTQQAYENGFFYLPDKLGTYHWEGQHGGIEGLNQYTWMTVYIPQMRYALNEFGLHYFVMAYGDDYKAALLIPPDQKDIDISVLREKVVAAVSNTARIEFGQNMKYFDSYGSETYISFCKHASVNACEMPQGVRKIQKCYGATNAFLPTLDDYISSAFSNAHAAAKTMPCTYPAYRVALFWGYLHLLTHAEWKGSTDIELHAAMLTPSCAGGLPVLFLSNFHTRAENDHLPMFIDLCFHIKRIHPELYLTLTNAFTFERLEPDQIETLLRDPYSLPIKKPPLPSGILRGEILPALAPIVRNSEIRALMEAAEEDWTERIISAMRTCQEYHARVFSSVYACTPKAMIEEIVKRFETSGSLRDILVMRRGPGQTLRILRRVLHGELTLQRWRRNRFRNCYISGEYWRTDLCSTELANTLRQLWGKPVIGVTMPAMPHLISIVNDYLGAVDQFARKNHFTYTLHTHKPVLQKSPSDHWNLGGQKPFLGHKTKLGSEVPQLKIIESNPFLSKIKTLLDIVSWVEKGERLPDGTIRESNFSELIFALLSQYVRGDPRELLPFAAKRRSGTVQHHWRSPHYSEHIMPNTLANTYTWISGESNTHEKLRGTVDHHTLNFLQVYCFVVHMLQLELEVSCTLRTEKSYWAITNDCEACMKPIYEPPIVLDPLSIPTLPRGTLEGLQITYQSRQIIGMAYKDMIDKRPREHVEHDLPTNLAVCGIVQALSEQSGAKAQRMCDRLNTVARTQEELETLGALIPGGYSVPIKEREIRHSPMELLASNVLTQVYRMSFALGRRSTARRQLMRLWQANPRSLPWAPMIDSIHKAGRLTDLIITVQKMSSFVPPMCYDNVLTATRFIGEVALYSGLHGNPPLEYVWLTYYEDDDVEQSLHSLHTHLIHTAVWIRLKPLLLQSMRAKTPDQEMCGSLILAIYSITCSQSITGDSARKQIDRSPAPVTYVMLADYWGAVTEDIYTDALEEPDHMVHEVAEELNRIRAPFGPHPPNLALLEQYSDNADEIYAAYIEPINRLLIYRTTLADCIMHIRGLPDATPLEYKHGVPCAAPRDLMYDDSQSQRPHFGFLTVGDDLPDTDIVPVKPGKRTVFECDELILDTQGLSRQYGHATNSLNKILEVMSIVGLREDGLNSTNIMCLGEGYGGIVDLFAQLGTRCHFLYNTIPANLRTYVTPAVAIDHLRSRNHSWDEELVNTAVYDLRSPATVHAIITNDNLRYSIVTYDSEPNWADPAEYKSLLLNIVHLYLSKRTVNGALICRVFLEYSASVIAALSLLSHYCAKVGLIRCRASPPGGECYMVGMRTRRPYDRTAPGRVNISPKIDRLVTTTTNRLKEHWTRLLPPTDYTVTLTLPAHHAYLKKFRNILPCGPTHRLLGRHQLPLTLTDADRTTPRALLSGMLRELRTLDTMIRADIDHGVDTAAGMTHLVMRSLLVHSCHAHLTAICKKNQSEWRHGVVRRQYLEYASTLSHRVVLPDPPVCFLPKIEINGITCSPFKMWLEGWEIAAAYWAYTR